MLVLRFVVPIHTFPQEQKALCTHRTKQAGPCTYHRPQALLDLLCRHEGSAYLEEEEEVEKKKCTNCTPVSYTHLDVYKRQVLYHTVPILEFTSMFVMNN